MSRRSTRLNAEAQKQIDALTLQQLKDAVVAGLHAEGGWLVHALQVEKAEHSKRYVVSFIAEER